MKILHIFTATGLAVASLTISTSADAQRWNGHRGGGWHDRGYHDGYRGGWHGRDYRGYRGYWHGPRYRRYRHYGWRGYGWRGPRCWTEWRYGYRVRICR